MNKREHKEHRMNVLEKIVLDKRQEVECRIVDFPLSQFEQELTSSDRDFKQALKDDYANKSAAFILECKKASPSKGLIREHFDLDEICQAYGQYATCVSVLTDEKYFQGEFERLPKVRSRLSQPVLCKDFFVHPYQVHLARYFGANAILLMLSVLTDAEYQELAEVAQGYGMAILTEVSNEQEMRRAVELKADILGINNRNLRDLSTDLNQTPVLVSLFKQLASQQQQQDTVLISESGIYHNQQVKLLLNDVQGFLVGSSLMVEKNLINACRDLIKGEHKVCGLNQDSAVKAAIASGAKYQGLIFVETSPRAVNKEQAEALIEANPDGQFVLVVRDYEMSKLTELVKDLKPKAVQLHGKEDDAYITKLRESISTNVEIWRALAVSDQLPTSWPSADKIVLDTKAKDGSSGGTGQKFDWQVLSDINFESPKIMLAGGINQDNVIDGYKTYTVGLDINSGVETSPGVKSEQKIKDIFQLLKI